MANGAGNDQCSCPCSRKMTQLQRDLHTMSLYLDDWRNRIEDSYRNRQNEIENSLAFVEPMVLQLASKIERIEEIIDMWYEAADEEEGLEEEDMDEEDNDQGPEEGPQQGEAPAGANAIQAIAAAVDATAAAADAAAAAATAVQAAAAAGVPIAFVGAPVAAQAAPAAVPVAVAAAPAGAAPPAPFAAGPPAPGAPAGVGAGPAPAANAPHTHMLALPMAPVFVPPPAPPPLPELEDLAPGLSALRDPANFNRGPHNHTALHAAATLGDVGGVGRALQAGADPLQRNALGDTAVHLAARGGHLYALQALLAECGEEGANVRGWQLRTPLHTAAVNGRLAEASVLLDAGARADVCDAQGNSPLHLAAASGQHVLAGLLLSRGAAVNTVNACGRLALDSAAFMGHAAVARLLLGRGAGAGAIGFPALCTAATRGHAAVVRLLVDAGADVRGTDRFGKTALHYAAEGGQAEAAQALLSREALVHATDKNGRSPLLYAAHHGSVKVVKLLIENDALRHERSPAFLLFEAARRGHGDVVELLLRLDPVRAVAPLEEAVENAGSGSVVWAVASAAPERFKAGAKNALIVAAQSGRCEAMCAIISAVASVDWVETIANALYFAAAGGHTDCVAALLYAGADSRMSFRSPLHAAAKKGHLQCVKLLVERGADVNAKEGDDTPLGLALAGFHVQVADVLMSAGAKGLHKIPVPRLPVIEG